MQRRIETVSIVGNGFCGLMTAVNLIRKSECEFSLRIFVGKGSLGTGPAYSTSNFKHILNVPTAKMSCIPEDPEHFLNWVSSHESYRQIPKDMLAISFMPRAIYSEYLRDVWDKTIQQNSSRVSIEIIDEMAVDAEDSGECYNVFTESGKKFSADVLVLATGNDLPGNPKIFNMDFYSSPKYFRNPWDPSCTGNVADLSSVLIIGNGLTMVDTVISLIDNGFNGTIYSLSPHGLSMLQHRHGGIAYKGLIDELSEPYELDKLFLLFKKHVKLLRQIGISAEPVVDSLRSVSQKIWMNLTNEDKKRFLDKLRHLWGVARHRVPIHVYDKIIRLKLEGKLKVLKGSLIDMVDRGDFVEAVFHNRRTGKDDSLNISRVINCTGPMTDIEKSTNPLILSLIERGTIRPDELKLGIDSTQTFQVIGIDGLPNSRLFTLGGNLKGLLWESTAVPELRVQAASLADLLLQGINEDQPQPTT